MKPAGKSRWKREGKRVIEHVETDDIGCGQARALGVLEALHGHARRRVVALRPIGRPPLLANLTLMTQSNSETQSLLTERNNVHF